MADSVVEQIAQALVEQLETVTVLNGYEHNVRAVIRPRTRGDWWNDSANEGETLLTDRNLVVVQGSRSPVGDREAYGLSEYNQAFEIHCVVMDSETGESPIESVISSRIADVERAIMGDNSWWQEVDGAVNVTVAGDASLPDGAACNGRTLNIIIHYRHNRGDPYTYGS